MEEFEKRIEKFIELLQKESRPPFIINFLERAKLKMCKRRFILYAKLSKNI